MTHEEYLTSITIADKLTNDGLAAMFDLLDKHDFRERVWQIVHECGQDLHAKDPKFNHIEMELALWTYFTDVMFHPFAGMDLLSRQAVAIRYAMMLESVLADAPANPGETVVEPAP